MYSLQKERLTRRKHHWGLLGARHVIPMHYGLPGTTGTPAALRDAVARLGLRGVEVLEMTPGQTIAAPSR